MNSLVRTKEAARTLNVPEKALRKLIEETLVPVALAMPYGRGVMNLFKLEDLEPLAAKYQAAQAAKKPQAEPAPVATSAPFADLSGLEARITALLDDADENEARHLRLTEQNRALLKLLDKNTELLMSITGRLSTLESAVANISAVAMAPAPINVIKPATLGSTVLHAVPPQKLPRVVVVVGLFANLQKDVVSEFGQLLDLRFAHADDTKGKDYAAMVTGADHVVVMTNHVNHSATEVAKARKAPFTHCRGSVSSLREILTTLAVELNEKKAA